MARLPHPERTPRYKPPVESAGSPKTKKPAFTAGAWEEARGLIWIHRKRLALGLGLMLINRLSGFVLPTTTKYLMDDVITQGHWELLPTLAWAAAAATVVDASTAQPGLDLPDVLHALSEKGISRLMVEGGARVASSFVAAGLIDEVWLLRGPDAVGVDGVPALDALPLSALTGSPDRKSTRLNSSHPSKSRMPSSA